MEIWHRLTFSNKDEVEPQLDALGIKFTKSSLPGHSYILHVDIAESDPLWNEVTGLATAKRALDVFNTVFSRKEGIQRLNGGQAAVDGGRAHAAAGLGDDKLIDVAKGHGAGRLVADEVGELPQIVAVVAPGTGAAVAAADPVDEGRALQLEMDDDKGLTSSNSLLGLIVCYQGDYALAHELLTASAARASEYWGEGM